jgi:hypothetical protein
MKKMQLGKFEVAFNHMYHNEMIWSDKKGGTIEVKTPVATTATVSFKGFTAIGRAVVAKSDSFNYEKGRKTALKKALFNLKDTCAPLKGEKKRMWDDYNKLKPGGRW